MPNFCVQLKSRFRWRSRGSTRYHHEMFGTNANIFGVPVPLKITADHHVHTWTPPLLLCSPPPTRPSTASSSFLLHAS